MPFDNERIARSVKAKLESDLAAALAAVETAWAAEPLTLPDPVTWYLGHKPDVVDMASAEFPFVAVIPVGRTPQGGGNWFYQEQSQTVYVDWFVVADTATNADVMCSRYAEAVLVVMQSQCNHAGWDQVNKEPQIDLSEASRHPKTLDADMFEDEQVDYIKMGRMTLRFGHDA